MSGIQAQTLPCPFCGCDRPDIERWHGGGPEKRLISCSNEECDVAPSVSGETLAEAVLRWNQRAPFPAAADVPDAEDRFEQYVATLIARAPSARRLGERLAELLDDDQFNGVNSQLLALARMEATQADQQPGAAPAIPAHALPILAEIERATTKFPTWPTDPLHAYAVFNEEAGELGKAVLQAVYEPHKSGPGEVATEAVQAAAMAIRFIASLDRYVYSPGDQHQQTGKGVSP